MNLFSRKPQHAPLGRPEAGLPLSGLLDECAAHDHRKTADALESLRNRLGSEGLGTQEWNALVAAASHLRIEARRREGAMPPADDRPRPIPPEPRMEMQGASLFRLTAASTRFRPGQSGNPAGRPKGIGENITEARRIAARVYREAFDGRPLQERAAAIAAEIEAGARDDSPEVVSVLAGLKRGRELGRRGK